MKNLIQALLQTRFGDNTEAIMELLEATPNPEVGAEILMNIYEEPEINEYPHENLFGSHKVDIEFKSYNKWTDEVVYTYRECNSLKVWLKPNAEFLPTYDDIMSNKDKYHTGWDSPDDSDDYSSHTVFSEPKDRVYESSTSRITWNTGSRR